MYIKAQKTSTYILGNNDKVNLLVSITRVKHLGLHMSLSINSPSPSLVGVTILRFMLSMFTLFFIVLLSTVPKQHHFVLPAFELCVNETIESKDFFVFSFFCSTHHACSFMFSRL